MIDGFLLTVYDPIYGCPYMVTVYDHLRPYMVTIHDHIWVVYMTTIYDHPYEPYTECPSDANVPGPIAIPSNQTSQRGR